MSFFIVFISYISYSIHKYDNYTTIDGNIRFRCLQKYSKIRFHQTVIFVKIVYSRVVKLLFLGYKKCPHLSSKTCNGKFKINETRRVGLDECKKRCDKNTNCRFIYHYETRISMCIEYMSCDELRVPKNPGMTYSKEWKCPNNMAEMDESM